MHSSSLEELEKLVLEIKAEVKQKEEENVALSQQIQQYEKKWSLCEEKMKSMEEMYKKQIETLTVRPITQLSKSKDFSDTMTPLMTEFLCAEVTTD